MRSERPKSEAQKAENQGRDHVFCFGGRAIIWGAYDGKYGRRIAKFLKTASSIMIDMQQ